MDENKPYFDEQLRRITSRMEIFEFEPEARPWDQAYDERNSVIFLPANDQKEGVLAVEADEWADIELRWRIAREDKAKEATLLWECDLSDWYVEFRQSFVENATLTPEMIERYLRYDGRYPEDKPVFFAPVVVARLTREPGADLSYHSLGEDTEYPRVPSDTIKQVFEQPE